MKVMKYTLVYLLFIALIFILLTLLNVLYETYVNNDGDMFYKKERNQKTLIFTFLPIVLYSAYRFTEYIDGNIWNMCLFMLVSVIPYKLLKVFEHINKYFKSNKQ